MVLCCDEPYGQVAVLDWIEAHCVRFFGAPALT